MKEVRENENTYHQNFHGHGKRRENCRSGEVADAIKTQQYNGEVADAKDIEITLPSNGLPAWSF